MVEPVHNKGIYKLQWTVQAETDAYSLILPNVTLFWGKNYIMSTNNNYYK